MAEGFARLLGQGRVEVHSAGMEPSRLNPTAVAVMQEKGHRHLGPAVEGLRLGAGPAHHQTCDDCSSRASPGEEHGERVVFVVCETL
ncbi:MAG TPA: hypothetical protein VEH53_06990 [archaeon]|nr:hypothetical protein [archaeon]